MDNDGGTKGGAGDQDQRSARSRPARKNFRAGMSGTKKRRAPMDVGGLGGGPRGPPARRTSPHTSSRSASRISRNRRWRGCWESGDWRKKPMDNDGGTKGGTDAKNLWTTTAVRRAAPTQKTIAKGEVTEQSQPRRTTFTAGAVPAPPRYRAQTKVSR